MAYYSSSYAGSGFGEYNYNSYAVNYEYDQNPGFMDYSDQDFCKPHYGYDQSVYNHPTPAYTALSYPTISYSATTFSKPKFIEYDPNYGKSQLVIYYSNLEFNEPEFDEYDPTPYDGGYDIAQTYGKPLPPSNEICYPRYGSDSSALPARPLVPLPAVEKEADEKAIIPQNGSADQVVDEMPQPQISLRDLPVKEEDKIHDTQDLNPYDGEDIKEHDDDDSSRSGSESGHGNGYNGGNYDEYEKPVPPQYPGGYGLEAMDLCESLFGYWPCLARMKKMRENCCEEGRDDMEGNYCYRENMWKSTADYLFGSPYPYGGGRAEEGSSYGGELVHAYQRHYPMQTQYNQVEYNENSSW